MIKLFSMFSGYGGAEFALKQAGIPFECVGYSEIDKFAIQCYDQNHPGIKNYGDCRSIMVGNAPNLPDFDLLTGGFPCQVFSIAGKQLGESDPRGTLFYEIVRIAEIKQPKFMLLENVKGLTSKKFKSTFDKILSELGRIGYNVDWKVLNSKDYGIPQSRARVWFVCVRKDLSVDFKWPEPEPLTLFIKDILEPEVYPKYHLNEKQVAKIIERLNEKRLQGLGFGELPLDISSSSSLTSRDYKEPKVIALRSRDNVQMPEIRGEGCSNTITSVQKDNLVIDLRKYKGEKFARTYDKIVPTLMARARTDEAPIIMNCLTEAQGRQGSSTEFFGTCEKIQQSIGIFRRLTPKEAFRLMGFFNDEIKLDGISDSQRYKLAGNGWAMRPASNILRNLLNGELK